MEPSDAKPVSPAALDKGCTCSPTLNCNGEGVSSDHALRSRVAGCTVVSSATGLSLLVWRGRKNRATCNDVRAGSTLLKLTQPFSGVVVDPSLGLGLRSESWTTRPIASDVLPTARPTGSNVSAVHSRVLHDLKCDGYAFSRIGIVLRHGLGTWGMGVPTALVFCFLACTAKGHRIGGRRLCISVASLSDR